MSSYEYEYSTVIEPMFYHISTVIEPMYIPRPMLTALHMIVLPLSLTKGSPWT